MKFIKKIYRIFTRNFLIYMSPEAPSMDYHNALENMGVKDIKRTIKDKEQVMTGDKFADKKEMAQALINKIDLDANPEVKTQKEKDLEKALTDRNDKQFALLEHNYRRAVKELGTDREEEKGGIRQAEDILYKSTDKFISQLEVHVFQLSAEKGDMESKGLLIEEFLDRKGIQAKGMGKFLAEALGSRLNVIQNCKTKEEIYKTLEKILDDKTVLQNAVQKLIEGQPKFGATQAKREYFWRQFTETENQGDERLAARFGDKNKGNAAHVLAMRFHIDFEKKGNAEDTNKPKFIVDLTTNTIYDPNGSEWKEKLKSVCHEELNNPRKIQQQNEALIKMSQQKNDRNNELKQGKWGPDWEVHKLSRLNGNPLLTDLLRTTVEYQEATTREAKEQAKQVGIGAERIRSLASDPANKDSKQALEALASTLTPERARDTSFVSSLGELIKMIGEALGGKNAKSSLNQIKQDIDANKNPVEMKRKVIKMFVDTLNNPKSQPKLDQLLGPSKTDDFFKTEALKQGTEAMELASRYPEERAQMVKDYLIKNLGVEGLDIRILAPNKYKLTINKGEIKFYELEKDKEDGFTLKPNEGKAIKLDENSLSALKKAIETPIKTEAPATPEVVEKPKSEADLAKDVLYEMRSNNFKKPSKLGALIKSLGLKPAFDKEDKKEWKKEVKDSDKQFNLDTARADFIYNKILNKDKKITIPFIKSKNSEFKTNFDKSNSAKSVPKQTGTPKKIAKS